MKRILATITAAVAVMFCSAQQPYYSFKHYSVTDGLSQNDVTSIIQDKMGFIWFGTWDGLNKFDGYNFTTYKAMPGDDSRIATNRINFLYEDQLGYIWFQTYDLRLHRLDPRTERFYSIPQYTESASYNFKRINWFQEIRPGEIWTKTRQGALRIVSKGQAEPQVTTYAPDAGHKISSTEVNFIRDDAAGNVWIGTDKGLNCIHQDDRIETFLPGADTGDNNFTAACATEGGMYFGTQQGRLWYIQKSGLTFTCIDIPGGRRITDIDCIDRYLLIATAGNGLLVYDQKQNSTQQFNTANTPSITSNNFTAIIVDQSGIAWIENQQNGIFRYRCSDRNLKHFAPKIDAVHSYSVQSNLLVYEDADQTLWVYPRGGGFSYYDREHDELHPFFNEPGSADCKFSNVIHTAFSDRQGNLWMSTYNKGVEMVSQTFSQFQHHTITANTSLTANEVRAVMQTSDNQLFISTKDGITRLYDANCHLIGILSNDGYITQTDQNHLNDLIYCMHEDSQHRIWLGSKGGGIILLTQQGRTAGIPRYEIRRFTHDASDSYSLSNDNVYCIKEDAQGIVYIGTYGGGLNIVEPADDGRLRFINHLNLIDNYPIDECSKIRDLDIDRQGNIWVGTTNGLLQMDKVDTHRYNIYHCQREPGNINSISNNDIHCVYIDPDDKLWLGTFGGGLNSLVSRATSDSPASFQAYTKSDGLFSDLVLAIVDDQNGNLWITSENYISRFDKQTRTFQNYNILNTDEQDNTTGYFSEAAGLRLKNKHIILGSNQGYYLFAPQQISLSSDVPDIRITNFLLSNQVMRPGAEESPLTSAIGYADTIVLKYNQNQFSIEYAAIDYRSSDRIQYAFYMEGVDKDWNYVQHQRRATYTSLPHGTYRFHVRSTNEEGIWLDNERVLTFIIKPAPWQTGWAYLCYLLIAIGVLFLVYWITSRFATLKNEVEVEQKVADIKIRFFTNISHELRTPLSLIQGPVENILHNEKISPNVREQLLVVQNNSTRMMRLINEILDLRKAQEKQLRLRLQQTHLYDLACKTYRNFTKEAEDRHIKFTVENHAADDLVWIDRDKIEIVLHNLLSNAFKYSPSGKQISVQIDQKPNFLIMRVSDQGVGIPKDKRNILFERFTNHNELQKASQHAGTGIGLSLVKEIVDLHKGYIEVESELNRGTTFSIILQTGRDHFTESQVDFVVEDPVHDEQLGPVSPSGSLQHKLDIVENIHKLPKLLVVEDNEDMRRFLASTLGSEYSVIQAADGQQGVDMAIAEQPVIIVSDLMMPNKDGLELTRELKQDQRTSHIPIILLTAKTALEDRIEALDYGADDYIAKPFSPIYLQTRLRNILKQRARLQENFRQNLLEFRVGQTDKDISPDEAFLAKLMNVMERNMDNSELTVDHLVSEMSLGRTVFFNKLKGLTGLSPVEFIREVRIKRAAQLLEVGRYNITEITYMVGMNDSRYFSKCFKAAYGMTPSEYKKNLQGRE
ncbi:MAG: response regulator [Paludibacteraceae bacterium]|nr:response regulator [Paludibacteraceae bacterium]